jgi:hypothetical protein
MVEPTYMILHVDVGLCQIGIWSSFAQLSKENYVPIHWNRQFEWSRWGPRDAAELPTVMST